MPTLYSIESMRVIAFSKADELVAGGQTITLETPRKGSDVGWAATLVRVE